MYSIKRLSWDSNFFNKSIGEISFTGKNVILSNNHLSAYNLLIHKQDTNISINIEGFKNTFQEIRCLFSKKIESITKIQNVTILDYDTRKIFSDDLVNLAYESGKFSRFKLDPMFTSKDFHNLYDEWIKNSLNKSYADKIFFIEDNNSIIEFVSLQKHFSYASIGLIAVSKDYQGKGLGKLLITQAENYCVTQNILELRIPTQQKNLIACNFYSKLNYKITNQTYITHFWNLKK